eukprot:365244-Chlamydomonas_euryale.AAC.8
MGQEHSLQASSHRSIALRPVKRFSNPPTQTPAARAAMVEKSYPEMIPYLSTCKSPQMMMGAVIKNFFAHDAGVEPNRVLSCSLMPCVRKQSEADRPDGNTAAADGRDVDHVVTTVEMAAMLADAGIDLTTLEESVSVGGVGAPSGDVYGLLSSNAGETRRRPCNVCEVGQRLSVGGRGKGRRGEWVGGRECGEGGGVRACGVGLREPRKNPSAPAPPRPIAHPSPPCQTRTPHSTLHTTAQEFDDPLGTGSGGAQLFGTTGGVMEAALRTVVELVEGNPMGKVVFEEVRSGKGGRATQRARSYLKRCAQGRGGGGCWCGWFGVGWAGVEGGSTERKPMGKVVLDEVRGI